MSKTAKRILSICLAITLVFGSAGATALAMTAKNHKAVVTTVAASEKKTVSDDEKQQVSKDETIYVLAGSDGSVNKIIVSDWIKNKMGLDSITDSSETKDILNLKDDQSYTMGTDNAKVWDAKGKDIYYQGSIEKELPVALKVSYKLDGKSVSADEIAGKSGKVTIRFDYQNKQYEQVEIDGKKEKMYVPYVMLTGMLFDNNVFSNVEVTNGKLINDGQRTAVIGLALPGLQENLKLDKDVMEIPDYVEITADAKDFNLGMTATIATNEVFNKVDMTDINSISDLTGSMESLNTAMKQLMDGSSQLYGGLCTLLDKSGALVTGINKLAAGGAKAKAGADGLAAGSTELEAGTKDLYAGLNKLSENNTTLNTGAGAIFDSIIDSANKQLTDGGITLPTALTKENYAQVLDDYIANLTPEAVTAQVKQSISENYGAQIKEGVVQGVLNMSTAEYDAAVATGAITPEVKGQINAAIDQQIDLTGIEAIKSKVKVAKDQLDSVNEFYTGLKEYTAGVGDAKTGAGKLEAGANKLKAGSAELDAGIGELYAGIVELKDNGPTLVNGITDLKNGAFSLSEGLKQFNEDAVQKLVRAVDGDVKGLITRVKATADVSKKYKTFSGLSDDMDGEVRFIYRTDSVEAHK